MSERTGTTPGSSLGVERKPMTLDGEYAALFASMFQAVPTFHRFGRINRKVGEDGDTSVDYTACGLLVSSYTRSTGRLKDPMTWVPMRHALAFGKPCRKCFPDA